MLRAPRRPGLVPLAAALEAMGDGGLMGTYADEIPLAAVVGSAARSEEFDADFRPGRRPTERWRRTHQRFADGALPPPVDVVRLGGMYFVLDGHHRVSVARHLGWDSVPARVRHVCTIAFAMACLRAEHLASKAAERRFLEEVPLPDDVRRDLWLDDPADWSRMADRALAWAWRAQRDGGAPLRDPETLAEAWWHRDVMPRVEQAGPSALAGRRPIEVYAAATSL